MQPQKKNITFCQECLKAIDQKAKTYNACLMCDKCLCLVLNCNCSKFHPTSKWIETSKVFSLNQLEMD